VRTAGEYIEQARRVMELGRAAALRQPIVARQLLDTVQSFLEDAREAPGGRAAEREILDVEAEAARLRVILGGAGDSRA
jgi:hypothetical protein